MTHVPRHGPARRGFSLIELLVVISIIAILIGILLPSLKLFRTRAIKVACLSNLRQIGLGIQGYTQDFAGVYPKARYIPAPFISSDPDPPLHQTLLQYIPSEDASGQKTQKVYRCPGDDVVYPLCGQSYQYNSTISGMRIDDFWPVKFFGLSPSEVWIGRDYDGGTFDTTTGQLDVPFFHDLRNLLFADGHAGNFRP